jgi:hypothetical protein
MDPVVIGVIGSLLGVAIGAAAQEVQARRNRRSLLEDAERSHTGRQDEHEVPVTNDRRQEVIGLFKSDLGMGAAMDGATPAVEPSTGTAVAQAPGREMRPKPWEDRTDQAALMGTALAAIFATVITPGEYTVFDVVAGLSLSFVLAGYYQPPPVRGWEARRKALALGGVAGLLTNLTFAWPVQELLLRLGVFEQQCGDDAECVANQITVGIMPIVSAAFFLIGARVGRTLIRRAEAASAHPGIR